MRRYLSSLLGGHLMSDIDALPTAPCPNCRQPMQTQDLERHDHGSVRVELCFTCAGIWFDHLASVELAPPAVIELFKEIQSHRDDARQPVVNQLTCPRCNGALALSFDLSKSGRFPALSAEPRSIWNNQANASTATRPSPFWTRTPLRRLCKCGPTPRIADALAPLRRH